MSSEYQKPLSKKGSDNWDKIFPPKKKQYRPKVRKNMVSVKGQMVDRDE